MKRRSDNAGGGLTEEEMAELIESKTWPPYRLEMEHCREGKASPNGKHARCPGRRQPTNHIDPHPTICTCECHMGAEDVEWDDDEVWVPTNEELGDMSVEDLEFTLVTEAARVAEMINEGDDEFEWDDEEELDWDEV